MFTVITITMTIIMIMIIIISMTITKPKGPRQQDLYLGGRRHLLAVQLISSPAPAYTITFSVWGLKTHKQTNKQTYIQQTKPAYLSTCCVFDHLFRKSPLTFSALSLEP